MIDALTMDETVDDVHEYIKGHKPLHLMGVNADKINMLQKNARLAGIVNSCKIINADGASVIMASRILKCFLPERVAGIDLMQRLVALAARKGYSIYLLGARQTVVEKTAENLIRQYPNLKISGSRNGYFPESEWQTVADQLKQKNPQIVFVGISSPQKEYLVEFLQQAGLNCVFMGVGGSFDVISGQIPRAPVWMRKLNLEWLFRLMQEPKRLWKRYLIGNAIFLFRVFKQKYFPARRSNT
jgi:N-acetylglucosaminyldiphosphoundecaprenol N-acetyl-beta-D-mannosaminyltransferase